MSEEEKRQIEEECLLNCSKAKMIEKYIYELEESSKLSELWCKSQQENQLLKEIIKEIREYIKDACYDHYFNTYKELPPYVVTKLLQILDKVKENK